MTKNYEHVPKVLPSSIPVPSNVITVTSYVWYVVQRWFFRIPGAHYVADYVAKSHQDDPYRTIVEIGLIIYGIVYYLSKPWKQGQETQSRLSAREVDQLIEEWEPEPLVVSDERSRWRLGKIPVVKPASGEGLDSCLCDVSRGENEHYEGVVNLASNDYLRLSRRPEVLAEVKKTIQNYGVGACGPAGFYGNQDQHYNLEYELAAFFGTDGAVLYGQDFCAAPSVIPAFTKRGDVIVADDQVSVALQNALQLSRSTVYYFKHNDMNSLEELLSELDEHERAERLPTLPRKFIVTEGLFHNIGDIAPLPELVKLKRAYRYRLIVDEMHSIGVLGRTGRGLPEHFNMERGSSIDITIGSMATTLGASGAFVLGDSVMTHHQRIGSNAYCFSASLPPYICAAVREVLRIMDSGNSAVKALRENSSVLHDCFKNDTSLKGLVRVVSDRNSSVLHLQITPSLRTSLFGSSEKEIYEEASTYQARSISNKYVDAWEREERFLQQVVDRLLKEDNILISRNTISLKHHSLPVLPGLKVICNAEISQEQLVQYAGSIREALLTCIDDNSSSTN